MNEKAAQKIVSVALSIWAEIRIIITSGFLLGLQQIWVDFHFAANFSVCIMYN